MTKPNPTKLSIEEILEDNWTEDPMGGTMSLKEGIQAVNQLLADRMLEAQIAILEKLKKERIIADVINPGEADDIFHAVTQLSIDVEIGHLKRELRQSIKERNGK